MNNTNGTSRLADDSRYRRWSPVRRPQPEAGAQPSTIVCSVNLGYDYWDSVTKFPANLHMSVQMSVEKATSVPTYVGSKSYICQTANRQMSLFEVRCAPLDRARRVRTCCTPILNLSLVSRIYKYNLQIQPANTTHIYYRHLPAQIILPGSLVPESQYN